MKKLTTLFLFASIVLAPFCAEAQNLEFRYKLDGNVLDSSPNNRTAANNGPVTFIADATRGGDVADFDGADDLASTGYVGPQADAARSGTMWIKTTNAAVKGFMEWGVEGPAGERWTFLKAGASGADILVAVKSGAARINGTAITDGSWHHIAFTYPAGGAMADVKLYFDGVHVANDVVTETTVNTVNGGAVKIGTDFGNRKFIGQMSDVRLYSKELSAAEVTTIMGETLSLKGVDLNQIASIYPNPVKDRLYIKTKLNDAEALNIKIYNTLGQLVNPPVYNKSNGTIEVDMKNLTPGLYFGTAKSKNASSSFKILKQ